MAADHYLQTLKQSFSPADMDDTTTPHLLMSNFPGLNMDHLHNLLKESFPPDTILSQSPDALESLHGFHIHQDITGPTDQHRTRKDNADHIVSSLVHYKSELSLPQVSNSGNGSKRVRRGKRVKVEEEKPKEVVHVRAKRGQATDSHSLAERVRRGKINERLRCLQDIVPGCYKTKGMAVMLDEIINYVQSLQNQVEFLSMKLTAATSFYDFKSEIDTIETMQRANVYEAMKVENNVDIHGLLPPQFAPLAPDFSCYPQLPYNR